MKALLTTLVLMAAMTLQAQTGKVQKESLEEESSYVKIGDTAPGFTYTDANGNKVTLSALKGKTILLSFWATWCGYCRKEMPLLQSKVWDKFKDNPNFVLLAIARGEDMEKVKSFSKKYGYTIPYLSDPTREIYDKYAKSIIPRNYIIDATGKVVYTSSGFNETEFDEMVKFLESRLK